MKTKHITLRLSEETLARLDECVAQGKASSKAKAIEYYVLQNCATNPDCATTDTQSVAQKCSTPESVAQPAPDCSTPAGDPETTKAQKIAELRELIARVATNPIPKTPPEEEKRLYTEYGEEGEKQVEVTMPFLLKKYGRNKANVLWSKSEPIH